MNYTLSGRKELIFDSTLDAMSLQGYDAVSMRNIAQSAGIEASSIYNHFVSKEAILDAFFTYFEQHFLDNRKPLHDIKYIIQTGTKEQIVEAMCFTFDCDDEKHSLRMVKILKIIYMLLFKDSRASEIVSNLMSIEGERYVSEVLDYAISIGRLKQFDTKAFGSLLVSQRHMTALKAFSHPGFGHLNQENEAKSYEMLASLLPFVECSVQSRC